MFNNNCMKHYFDSFDSSSLAFNNEMLYYQTTEICHFLSSTQVTQDEDSTFDILTFTIILLVNICPPAWLQP